MKDLSQYLQTTCDGANKNSIHSKVSKFVIAFYRLANNLSYYVFSKNANS